jgi:hypothetical protein
MTRAMLLLSMGLGLAVPGTPRAVPPGGTAFRQYERELKMDFQRTHPCPVNGKKVGNCPGYEVGYVLHPRNGGKISEDNMRWMTTDEYEQTHQEHSPSS